MQSENLLSHSVIDFESFFFSFMKSLAVETTLLAQKSLLSLLSVIGSLPDHSNTSMDVIGKDQRFPVAELFKQKERVEENKDASETEENDYSEDDESEDDDDSEEDSDGEEDDSDDDDSDINEGGNDDDDSGDEDDAEDDDSDDSDSDDTDSEDEDEAEDEDEQPQPPSKRKK